MESTFEDFRISIRSLARRPLFVIVAVLTLALGIGANTAMFSVIHAAVLSPLPFPGPERLARVYSTFEGRLCCTVSAPNFLDMRPRTTLFDDLVAYGGAAVAVTGDGDPVRLIGNRVTHGFFELLGAQPQIGRFITAADDEFGVDPVVVLADSLWRERYGADPSVLGRAMMIDSIPHTIIGVAPPEFRLTGRPQLFLPFAWDPENLPSRGSNFLTVIGRIRADTTLDAAMDELSAIYGRLVDEYPEQITNRGVGALTLDEWLIGDNRRRPLMVLWGAVAIVLLVACANVVNLMLARAEARQREFAVRAALGARRARLVRHFLSESVLVSIVGAALGIGVAWASLRLVLGTYGSAVPRGDEVGINGAVLGFTLAVALGTCLVLGLVPALQTTSRRLQTALRDGGQAATGGHGRLRQALVVIEVAAALILVIGAGLMLKSFWRLSQVDVGLDPTKIITARISLPAARYGEQSAVQAFFENLRAEIDRLPSVEASGLANAVPFTGTFTNFSRIMPEGEPDRVATFVETRTVDEGFFGTLGIDLLQGRPFERADTPGTATVVIVNRELARRLFPGGDAIGRNIVSGPTSSPMRIVGVVENVREHGPDRAVPPTIYFSTFQGWSSSLALVVRTSDDATAFVSDIRRIVRQLDPELPVYSIETLDGLIYDGLGSRRFSMSLLSIVAAVALALGAIGIYGVMAYVVEQQTREIGLRQALGASPGALLGGIVADGIVLAAIGITLGIVGATLLRNTLTSLLYEVSSLDAAVYAGVATILIGVAAGACLVPGWRAATLDPMRALRNE